MNAAVLTVWLIIAGMALLSVILLCGKGSFLVAGYNTSSQEEKAKYNEKRLCRVAGGGLLAITAILGVFTFYEFAVPAAISWLMPWGLLGVVALILVLGNTVCKVK